MAGFIIVGFLIVLFSRELPDAASIRGMELKVPLRVFSADDLLISEFGDERRKPLSYEDIPQNLINAVLASEDDGFFEHGGIDIKGLIRATLSNFRSGSSGQGASTITMQVARNFFLTRDKTYTRKIKEVILAIRLEQNLSKEEILSLYINKIFLGHRAYGFGAAAEVYYDKPIYELSLAEIAMLAGLPKAPSTFNPLRNPDRAIIRRNYVLGRLKELKLISLNDYQVAANAPISAEKHIRKTGLVAPHIAEMVRAQLTEQFGEGAYWQGLNVYTTIESEQQNAAAKALRRGLQAYDRRHGFRGAVGKVDLGKLQEANSELDEAYEATLSTYPNSQEQIPALVLASEEKSAQVWTSNFGSIVLPLESSTWAKRHKTANLVGNKPEAMSDIITAGDVIYIQPDNAAVKKKIDDQEDEIAQEAPLAWRLSQIPEVSGALISMQPNTGRILSLIGGYDFFLNKYNRAVQSIRQPGSNIKPFIYSAALDQGFTTASLISGAPIVITDPAHGTLWRPENYSGKFFGPTRMREALGKSMNLVSIRLLRAIGIPAARDYVSRFGVDMNRFSPTLTMALGSGGITPLEMLSAYGSLANSGYKVKPYFIEKITDRNGEIVFQAPKPEFCDACYTDYLPKPEPSEALEEPLLATDIEENTIEQPEPVDTAEEPNENSTADLPETYQAPRVMSHANNFLTVSMLKDVVRRGTARKALALNRQDLAGKTGTTNDYIDAWFTGFNSQVATTVWIGFDNPATMGRGEAGSVAALPIWVDYMKTGLKGVPEDSADVPEYIEEAFVNRDTGKRTDELDPDAIPEFFTIEELTPEYALMQSLDLEESSLIDANLDAEGNPLPTDPENTVDESSFDTLENEELDEETYSIDQEDRIIETEEETEGLF